MNIKISYFLFITILLTAACNSTYNIVDNDDLYGRDTIEVRRVKRNYQPNHVYYVPNQTWYGWNYSYGYPYQYYQSRTYIIIPRTEESFKNGKRPVREEIRTNQRIVHQRGRN